MENKKIKHFTVENRVEEISSLAEKIEKLARDWEFSPDQTMNVNLVLEEALTNIIFYAFSDKDKHLIKISVELNNNWLTIKIIDNGIPFNPLKQKPPDITLPVEDRPVGGLGIFLISKIMDQMQYSRKNNQNVLTLKKNI